MGRGMQALERVATVSPRHELLDRYVRDLEELARFEELAEDGLDRVESKPVWVPTPYEERYLPGLRLAGLDPRTVSLQNQADLHVHTHYSDGDDLDRVLARAEALQLDAIAITDHDTVEGALEARRRVHARRSKLAIIPGVEVSSKDGHIGALFVTRDIEPGLTARETVDRIHAMGGIAVAHHPYAPRLIEWLLGEKLGCGDLIREVPFDAIECTNAVPGYGSRFNVQTIQAMQRNHVRVAVTGSSDAHRARFIGKGRTYYAGNCGVSSLKHGLELGFTRGAEGYWKFREKVAYRWMLIRAVFRNVLLRRKSVN
ncbi:MAG: PHP domain-containing protein [Planctomycetes bacterium]|nr:PHP domain-containing protein [Planctomycetota bacterium]